jgi:hypothetical protein
MSTRVQYVSFNRDEAEIYIPIGVHVAPCLPEKSADG